MTQEQIDAYDRGWIEAIETGAKVDREIQSEGRVNRINGLRRALLASQFTAAAFALATLGLLFILLGR